MTFLCYIERLSAVYNLRAVLIEACVRSKIPFIRACFVDEWLIWNSSICVFSPTTSDRNCEAFSDKNSDGKHACLVMTSTMHRPIVFAVTFSVGYANR